MHFWSCDIKKHGIYKNDHISAIFKYKDVWFVPKTSLKLCADFTMFGVSRCISGHVTGHQLFFERKVPIPLKRFLLDIYLQLYIDRNVHLFFHLAP